jgi:chaperonin GroES
MVHQGLLADDTTNFVGNPLLCSMTLTDSPLAENTRDGMRKKNKELIVVGDRVLVAIEEGEERTNVGLYLPPSAVDNQAVQGGRIVATGPGQPMPDLASQDSDEPWKNATGAGSSGARHVPMQARTGDYALFFRKASVEITFEHERYLVVPQAAILALVRDTNVADDVMF